MNQFEVVRTLGKGAYASVLCVKRKADHQLYAVKVVKVNTLSKRELEDALNEIRLVASLRHQNIVGYYDSFLEGSNDLCIVMEHCDGGDLAAVIDRASKAQRFLDESLVLSYFSQICEGLQYLHNRRILHRDLKPGNIFLTREGCVKLGDFNVSKIMKQQLANTQIGTPYYMSPEIWKKRPYDSKSDIWSLGCILYELLALRPPFLGRSLRELGDAVSRGNYPRPPARYSSGIHVLVKTMLMVNPHSRPSTQMILSSQVMKASQEAASEATLRLPGPESGALLRTIHVPMNMQKITNDLPKPCYPDSRPYSPTSWPVIDVKKRLKHLPPISEDE